jgi:hypothetical protein
VSPTYEASNAVWRAYRKLPTGQRRAFREARDVLIAGLRESPPGYNPSLRVKRHQSSGPGVYELSFGDGGRALFRRGEEIRPTDPHIEWLAIGDHKIVE